jgi:uncharacterized protein (DUF983 family)
MIYYEATVLLFLLQGILLPFVVVITYLICSRQWRRSQLLERQAHTSQVRAAFAPGTAGLPHFRPLNCPHCGAGMLLETNGIFCPSCQQRGTLPPDYQRAAVLKERVQKLLKSALRSWRFAWFLTSSPVNWLLRVLVFAMPMVLLPIVLNGSTQYHHTHLDQWLAPYQNTRLPDLIFLIAAVGGFSWWLGIAILASYSGTFRRKLPVVPVFTNETHGSETANCQSCGGCIQYDRGEFVTICSYCHVENYRVQFARAERTRAEQQQIQVQFVLFDALTIVNEFLFKVWILGAMILVVVLVLCIPAMWSTLKSLIWK